MRTHNNMSNLNRYGIIDCHSLVVNKAMIFGYSSNDVSTELNNRYKLKGFTLTDVVIF